MRSLRRAIATLLLWPAALACSRANLDAVTRGTSDAASDTGDAAPDTTDLGADTADVGADVADRGADTADSGRDSVDGGSDAVACPTTGLQPGDTTENVQVNGTSRSYVLHVPTTYNGSKRVPLLVEFHFLGSTGSRARATSPYPDQTDPEGAIMAFPNGSTGPAGAAFNLGPCCVEKVDDVEFTRAVIAHVKSKACIDSRRVYAVGASLGGGMAYLAGCRAADVIAGVATSGWDLLGETVNDCKPVPSITVISFRSTGDPLVAYGGARSDVIPNMSVTFLGAEETFRKWAAIDGCSGSPSQDGNGCMAYSNCNAGVEVILCTKQGGGQDPANAAVSWPVLKRHTLP